MINTKKILLLTDDKTAAVSIRVSLSREGHDISVVPGSDEAVFRTRTGTFDLILVHGSESMPLLDACTKLRQNATGRAVRIPLAVTYDFSRPDQLMELVRTGVQQFIPRPFNPGSLVRHIRRMFRIMQRIRLFADKQPAPDGGTRSGALRYPLLPFYQILSRLFVVHGAGILTDVDSTLSYCCLSQHNLTAELQREIYEKAIQEFTYIMLDAKQPDVPKQERLICINPADNLVLRTGYRFGSFLTVALKKGGLAAGSITLAAWEDDAYEEHDRLVLQALAPLAAHEAFAFPAS